MIPTSLRNLIRVPNRWMKTIIDSEAKGTYLVEEFDYYLCGSKDKIEVYIPFVEIKVNNISYFIEYISSNTITIVSNKPDGKEYIINGNICDSIYSNFEDFDIVISKILIEQVASLLDINPDETCISVWKDDTKSTEVLSTILNTPSDILIIKEPYNK
jgi:hypothetical protein